MYKEMISLYNITSIIEDAGDLLNAHPRNTRILRLMQEKINDLIYETKDEEIIFVVDFLNNYIDRLWFNMAVDFSYEAGDQGSYIFNNLIKNVGLTLIDLVNAIRIKTPQKKYIEIYNNMLKLSNLYRKALYELQEKETNIGISIPSKIKNWDIIDVDQRELFKKIEECGAVYQSEHALAGGVPSYYFFDIDKLITNPESISVIAKYYQEEISRVQSNGIEIDKLAFIEKNVGTIGVLPIMSNIITMTKIPGFVVRFRKDFLIGEIKCAYNQEPKEKESVLIISDVLTAGGGIIKAKNIISRYSPNISLAITLYDREQGAKELLKKRYDIDVKSIIDSNILLKAFEITGTDYNFDPDTNPNAYKIPLASWKLKSLEKELGPEMMNRLKNAKLQ